MYKYPEISQGVIDLRLTEGILYKGFPHINPFS